MAEPQVSIEGCDEECVQIIDPYSDDPVVLYSDGPPGPQAFKKAGIVDGEEFVAGLYEVIFEDEMPEIIGTNYGVILTGTDGRNYTYQTKTVNGFVINANADQVIVGEVSWLVFRPGEVG